MPEDRYNPQNNMRPSNPPANGQVRRPRPDGAPAGPAPYRPRQAEARRGRPPQSPSYYNANRPIGSVRPPSRRKKRPTPFLVIIVVFIILLLIVIFTSKSCRNMFSGGDSNTVDGTSDKSTEKPKETKPESVPVGGESGEGTETDSPAVPKLVIYIDPGHGFEDSGASSDYLGAYHECDITLMVAKEVISILQSKGLDARLTHDGVNFPRASTDDGNNIFSAMGADKNERSVYANENNVGVFVSLHCDALPSDARVSGTRIHYCDNYAYADAAKEMTDMLVRSIGEAFLGARTVGGYNETGDDAYNVTRFTNAPSALIEMGFVTNEGDAASLLDPAWRTKMATGIANGIAAFAAGYIQ